MPRRDLRSHESHRIIHHAIETADEISTEMSSLSGPSDSRSGLSYNSSQVEAANWAAIGQNRNAALTFENVAMHNRASNGEEDYTSRARSSRAEARRSSRAPPLQHIQVTPAGFERNPSQTGQNKGKGKQSSQAQRVNGWLRNPEHGEERSSSSSDRRETVLANGGRQNEGNAGPSQPKRPSPPNNPGRADHIESVLSVRESVDCMKGALEDLCEIAGSLIGTGGSSIGVESMQQLRQRLENLRNWMGRVQGDIRNINNSSPEVQNLDREVQAMCQEVERLSHLAMESQEPDVRARNKRGQTLLHRAANNADLEKIQSLIQRGAAIDVFDNAGNTVLHSIDFSHSHNKVERVVQALLDAGSTVHEECPNGYTALHRAAERSRQGTVELLIRRGANVNARHARNGRTPLHMACLSISARKGKTVETLLLGGAGIEDMSINRHKPLDYALDALQTAERRFIGLTVNEDDLGSTIYQPCNQYRDCIETVDILIGRLQTLNLLPSSQSITRRSYFFQGMENFVNFPIEEARRRFRERRISITFQSDQALHNVLEEFGRRHSLFARV